MIVIFVVGLIIYRELNKDTIIIEPFQVPLDLEKQNITGQAIVNKLIDQIENIKTKADTAYKKFDVSLAIYDFPLEIVIPGSGISLKSLLQNVKNFLGRKQTRITGEVVLNKKLYLTIRVQGEPSKTFSGELEDLDNIMGQAAQYVLKYTQPYLLAFYLYYNYRGNREEALDMIQYSLSHLPEDDDAMAYTLWGYVLWDERKFDESIELYRKAISIDPSYVDAYNGWAYSLYELKKYDEASAVYKKALDLDPGYYYTYHYWGINLETMNKNDSAIEMYRKAIAIDPNYEYVYLSYGDVLLKEKKYDEAIEKYKKAIQITPGSADAFTGLGRVYYEQQNYKEALDMFKKSIQLNPDFADAYAGAGDVLNREKKFQESNEMFKKAIKLDSTKTAIYNKLALNLEEQKKYNEAIEIFMKAREVIPSDSVFIDEKINNLSNLRSSEK